MTPRFIATIENKSGTVFPCIRDKDQFFRWLASTYEEGQEVMVTVTKVSKERTHEQFKYLYSCVYAPVSEYTGMTMDEVDGVMKRRHLTVNPDSPMEYVKNKTDLDRAELAKYIDDCRADAASMGIETLDPQ